MISLLDWSVIVHRYVQFHCLTRTGRALCRGVQNDLQCVFRDRSSRCIPRPRPSGRLTGRGDRIRQKLFPVRRHVHSGENRKGGTQCAGTQPFLSDPSFFSTLPQTVLSQLPYNFLAILFLFLEWTMARPLPAFIPPSPSVSSSSSCSAKRIYLFREGGKTNVTILLVSEGKGSFGDSSEGGRRRVGGTLTSEIGDE